MTVKLLAATALSLTLSACVSGTTVLPGATPTVAQTPIPADNTLHYAGVIDDGFKVATVPVDKVPANFQMQQVAYDSTEAVGTIVINTTEKYLYYINGKNTAIRYGIGVGRAGFEWSGVANITSRTHWPKWTPPQEMIERSPEKAKWKDGMPGGPQNPLGARALYLTTNGVDYGYRIHGTPEWNTIGTNASSGCIRMINQDVMDLYNRVQDGAKVVVLNADGTYPNKLTLPPHAPTKKKPAPAPVEAVAPAPSATPSTLPGATTLPAADLSAVPAATPAPGVTGTMAPAATMDPLAPVAPATAVPAVAPAATAPVATAPAASAPAATAPATTAPSTCTVPLVNGVCPKP